MSDRIQLATDLFKEGYNCSQAVFAAYADLFGFSRELALKTSAGLGGGVGRSREVCGTVSAAAMLIGLKYGTAQGDDAEGKKLCYEKVQEYIAEFRKVNHSIVCRELLGLTEGENSHPTPDSRTHSYYKKRPCVQLVEDSARALENTVFKEMSL